MKHKWKIVGILLLGLVVFVGAAADLFNPAFAPYDAPPTHGFAITKSDADELSVVTRAIWVGTTGDLAVIYKDDTAAVTLKAVPVGRLSGRFKKVMSTNTTASDLVGEY
jgi:hypothetical protein